MALDGLSTADDSRKQALVGAIGGGVGFLVANRAVGGDDPLVLMGATAVATLALILLLTAAVD